MPISRNPVLAAAVAGTLATLLATGGAHAQEAIPPSLITPDRVETSVGTTQPTGVPRGNWIQTDPKKGWFTILRLYSPLESFFDKSWRPSEIGLLK